MKKCANCNKEYDDSKKFCPECGSALIPIAPSGINNAGASDIGSGLHSAYQQPQVVRVDNSASNNNAGAKLYGPRVLGVLSWLMIPISSFLFRGGFLTIIIDAASIIAAVYFIKVQRAASDEEREKAMKIGIIAFAIAVILLVIGLFILSTIY